MDIKETYVSFKAAQMLLVLGFPQLSSENLSKNLIYGYDSLCHVTTAFSSQYQMAVIAPSQSYAVKWLREEKDVIVGIQPIEKSSWEYVKEGYHREGGETFDTFEEATEAGIIDACEYLWEKVKEENRKKYEW